MGIRSPIATPRKEQHSCIYYNEMAVPPSLWVCLINPNVSGKSARAAAGIALTSSAKVFLKPARGDGIDCQFPHVIVAT
jgi:hypothetical protein